MSSPAERRIGNVIAGKWRVDSLLGSGSMAAVYSVTHRNGSRAALKILHPTLCSDPDVCERFLGEGYLANSVKHPGICRVLDDGVTDDGCVFLVMDLLDGKTLELHRDECGGQLPLLELLDIADRLMDVLRAVHEAGIIHRDLKLQNVFLCDDGEVKLLDFGVARLYDSDNQSKRSVFGMVLGTPSFMSPEQALGAREKVDHRSDIWSLGATLFTALTGQTVHLGPHLQAKLLAAATNHARPIGPLRPDLPAPIAAAIDKALRFEREDRWQSVEAFRRTLQDARKQLGLDAPKIPSLSWLEAEPATGEMAAPPSFDEEDAAGTEDTVLAKIVKDGPATLPHVRVAQDHGAPAHPPPSGPLPPQSHPLRGASESGPDGTFPAFGKTVRTGAQTAPVDARRSNLSTWLLGAVVAGALTGGAGFYVLRSSPMAANKAPAAAPAPSPPAALVAAPASASPVPLVSVAMPAVGPKEARAAENAAPAPTVRKAPPAPPATPQPEAPKKVAAPTKPKAPEPPSEPSAEPPPAAATETPSAAPATSVSAPPLRPLDPFDTPN